MGYTPIQERFWSDGWIRQLNALDRYLFLYLLTNGRSNLTGVYELPLDLMAAECGIDEKDLRMSMLNRLEPKIYYKEGWVIIKNFLNHRVSDSPKYLTGIRNQFDELPKHIQEISISIGYPIDTLSIPNRIRQDKIRQDISEPKVRVESFIPGKEDAEARPKYARKYPNAREVFGWFEEQEPSWTLNTTELKHAELLYERGMDAVRKALKYHENHKDDEGYGFTVLKPSDLERKWSNIAEYARKNK